MYKNSHIKKNTILEKRYKKYLPGTSLPLFQCPFILVQKRIHPVVDSNIGEVDKRDSKLRRSTPFPPCIPSGQLIQSSGGPSGDGKK